MCAVTSDPVPQQQHLTCTIMSQVIVVFNDNVTQEQIGKYAEHIIDNGGTVKDRYWESGIVNGFSATIPPPYLESFKSFRGDEIAHIESDQIVTTQQGRV